MQKLSSRFQKPNSKVIKELSASDEKSFIGRGKQEQAKWVLCYETLIVWFRSGKIKSAFTE